MKTVFKITFITSLFTLLGLAVWIEFGVLGKNVYFGSENISFEIPKGSGIVEITGILNDKGFRVTVNEMRLASKILGKDSKLRYGRFNYDPVLTKDLRSLIDFLTRGGHLTVNITIPEGSRIIDIAGILMKEMQIDSVLFVETAKDSALAAYYNIPAKTLEGYLYPETYNFNHNAGAENIIDRMIKTGRHRIEDYRKMIESSGFTEHEIITLASIIQGEVMVIDEIYHISAVYNNRLKRGMRLEADPTVQYLFDTPKRLLYKDIAIDSPYNTYLYRGLPPGPVNNPSVKAVKAALQPADVPYIFMVARGDGRHYFNIDYEGHLRDKAKFDIIRRQINR